MKQNLLFQFVTKTPLGVFLLVQYESTKRNSFFMPVKSPAATPTKTRKTRTRKTSNKKPVAPHVTVTTFKGGKVVKKQTTLKRPSTRSLITWERYRKDISTRWAIHNFEIQELLKDFSKGVEFVRPYHAQAVKTVKAWTV